MIRKKISDQRFFEVVVMVIESSFEKLEYENLLEIRKFGIPIGNLTSQLFANIYLNELDQFVKHKLKFRHYIRYMDDFLFLHTDKKYLGEIKEKTRNFLKENLELELHPKKAEIFPVRNGLDFLGYRLFYPASVRLRKGTVRRFIKRMKKYGKIGKDEKTVIQSLASWHGYAKHADSFALINALFVETRSSQGRLSLHDLQDYGQIDCFQKNL